MNYGKATSNIREQLAIYIIKNKLKSLVIGISGGMDSCLCAALAKPVCEELKIPLIGRSLPISTNAPDEIERATLTGKSFCTDFQEVNLTQYFNKLSDINTDDGNELSNEKSWKIRNGNIKARLRMIYLYNLASMNNGMVLSTDNYTEYLLGFWTLHGDVGDYGMIQNLWKTEVYDMAEWLANNECKFLDEQTALISTIEALATDGLGVSSLGDLGQILPDWKGNSRDGYKEVDIILSTFLLLKEKALMTPNAIKAIDKMITNPLISRHLATQFKRNNPANIQRNLIIK